MEICIFFTVMIAMKWIAGKSLPVPVMKHGLRGGEGKEEEVVCGFERVREMGVS